MKIHKQGLWALALMAVLNISACTNSTQKMGVGKKGSAGEGAHLAQFDWLKYEGHDPVYDGLEVGTGQFLNPILSGFYPDPSITRVDDKFYIVTSTFSYFPGLPVFESTDLVNWTQIGNAIDRPGMLDFKKLGMSRGVFAPVIKEHDGTFYIANTCVDCQGNFIVTAKNPAGPWSDPVWLPQVGGIDPSLFFDDDGKAYLMNNDGPPEAEPLYSGHRAIWMREIDPVTFQSISEPVVLINGGVRREEKPIWIEGPSIYKKGDWYYLSAAEGGTAEGHSQVVLRAKSVMGPYEAYADNPIMTQRHMPRDRANPVTSVGHAAFVVDNAGKWWASLLGVRPYEGDFYNTGRETFLLPVTWKEGWPVILERDTAVPYVLEKPDLPTSAPSEIPMHGNFAYTENFNGKTLDSYWLKIRRQDEDWYHLDGGALSLEANTNGLGDFGHPAFIGRRQQHMYANTTISLVFDPENAGDEAGLSAFQNDEFFYAFGISKNAAGERIVQLRKRAGAEDPSSGTIQAFKPLHGDATTPIGLKIVAKADKYDFLYKEGSGEWNTLHENADGKVLSTRTAGGFIGTVFGMYAVRAE